MISPGRVDQFVGITLPGYMRVLIPRCVPSPMMAPSLCLPESTRVSLTFTRIFFPSCRRLATFDHHPTLTWFPMIESPIQER